MNAKWPIFLFPFIVSIFIAITGCSAMTESGPGGYESQTLTKREIDVLPIPLHAELKLKRDGDTFKVNIRLPNTSESTICLDPNGLSEVLHLRVLTSDGSSPAISRRIADWPAPENEKKICLEREESKTETAVLNDIFVVEENTMYRLDLRNLVPIKVEEDKIVSIAVISNEVYFCTYSVCILD